MRTVSVIVIGMLTACKPPAAAVDDTPVTISIAALNDFHGALYEQPLRDDPTQALGGLPWLVAAVDALRAEDPDLVVLDGGDVFQGAWPVNATRGRGAVEALELVGLDVSAIGNHEFDYGGLEGAHPLRGALETAAAAADFEWLTANIRTEDGERWSPEGVAAWTVVERKGKRLGVIGLTTGDTPQTTVPKHVADLEFVDVVAAVEEVLPEVQAAEVDAMLLVAHLTGSCEPTGYLELGPPCVPDGEVGRLLTELPEGTFDVMVLGHAHTLLAHRQGDTFVLENRARGHALGRVDLVIGPDGVDADASRLHEPWPLVHDAVDPGCTDTPFPTEARDVGGRELTPDAEALALIEALEAEAGSLCTELTCASRALNRSRQAESELGDWMADAMLASFPGADLAIQNSGGIRADLPAGTVRREQLQQVMPFDNRALVVELTGEQVMTLFRLGTSGAHGILQVAGATVQFDPEARGGSDLDGDGAVGDWETNRLCDVTVGGQPLDLTATYKVVTSDFLHAGGDHLGPAFEGTTVVEEGALLRELMYDYAEQTEGCIGDEPLLDPESPRLLATVCPASSGD